MEGAPKVADGHGVQEAKVVQVHVAAALGRVLFLTQSSAVFPARQGARGACSH